METYLFFKNKTCASKLPDEWQTMKTLMRRRVLRRLIWVCTACSGLSARIHTVDTVTRTKKKKKKRKKKKKKKKKKEPQNRLLCLSQYYMIFFFFFFFFFFFCHYLIILYFPNYIIPAFPTESWQCGLGLRNRRLYCNLDMFLQNLQVRNKLKTTVLKKISINMTEHVDFMCTFSLQLLCVYTNSH